MLTRFKSILLCLIIFGYGIEATEHTWQPETALHIQSIDHVDVCPDGTEVVYTARQAQDDSYVTSIWRGRVNALETHFPIATGNYPRWSPDGKWIAFISRVNGINNLFLVTSDGTEATQITELPSTS